MERGWVKIYRKIQDNPLWNEKPFSRGQAWIDLLLLANHKDNYIIARGIKVDIKRGQVGWSEVKLSDRWGWSRSKLRTFLKLLESEQQIIQQKNNVSLLITIENYQNHQSKEQQIEQQKNSRKTAKEQQKDTNKNVKNEKNDKKEDKTFLSDSTEYILAGLLLNEILKRNPNHKKPNLQTWAKDIDKLIRIDERPKSQIHDVVKWCQKDSFWQNNILSAKKLREKFDQLSLKMNVKTTTRGLSREERNASEKEKLLKKYNSQEVDITPCKNLT